MKSEKKTCYERVELACKGGINRIDHSKSLSVNLTDTKAWSTMRGLTSQPYFHQNLEGEVLCNFIYKLDIA